MTNAVNEAIGICRYVFTVLYATKALRVCGGIALLFLGPRQSR